MHYTFSYGMGPSHTASALRVLLYCIGIISTASSLIDGFFVYYLGMTGPQGLLSLSWHGLSQWYIWQPLSFLFVLTSGFGGLSFSFFFELFLNLYLLWVLGNSLISFVTSPAFFRFYFITGILSGLLTLLCMPLLHQYSFLTGVTASVISVMTAWTMLYPDSNLLFFFIFPAKSKWLYLGIIGFILLLDFSHLDFVGCFFTLISMFTAYIYATTVWGLASPFEVLQIFDRFFIAVGNKCRHLFSREYTQPFAHPSDEKIFDFQTGQPIVDDDAFMDSILEKISKEGVDALSWSERSRMNRIAERKAREKDREL